METLSNLESFVRTAEAGSFTAAARLLGLTPAAVSRNVGALERNLGVRLFQRSTRQLKLTDAGGQFLASITDPLSALQQSIAGASLRQVEPAGSLKVSVPPTFGLMYLLPLLPEFRRRYPRVLPEWHFETRIVDVVGEGYDVAIGGGFDLAPGMVSRAIAPAHLVAVASPAYLAGRRRLVDPSGLRELDGIVMRSARSGRVRQPSLRNAKGREVPVQLGESMVVNDPAAMREAALLGLGVAVIILPDVLPLIEQGKLVRVLPRWYADVGLISMYMPSRAGMPAKTRVFVDYVADTCRQAGLMKRFDARST